MIFKQAMNKKLVKTHSTNNPSASCRRTCPVEKASLMCYLWPGCGFPWLPSTQGAPGLKSNQPFPGKFSASNSCWKKKSAKKNGGLLEVSPKQIHSEISGGFTNLIYTSNILQLYLFHIVSLSFCAESHTDYVSLLFPP